MQAGANRSASDHEFEWGELTVLYPSIDAIMEKVDSKYALVVGASRRARSLREGVSSHLKEEEQRSDKYVGIALEEIYLDYIRIENQKDQNE